MLTADSWYIGLRLRSKAHLVLPEPKNGAFRAQGHAIVYRTTFLFEHHSSTMLLTMIFNSKNKPTSCCHDDVKLTSPRRKIQPVLDNNDRGTAFDPCLG